MTDQKLLDLQQEVEQSQRHVKENENQCSTLKKQVINADIKFPSFLFLLRLPLQYLRNSEMIA